MLASKMMGGQRLGLCSCFLRLPISTYQSSSLLRPWSKPALSAINGSGGNKPLFVQRIMIRNRSLTTGSSQQQSSSSSASSSPLTFFQRFLGPKPMPPRNTLGWYKEVTLICTVFAITGTSTMMLVRPAVRDILGLQGSMKDGPWSYRICSIIIMSPIYGVLLVCVGTLFGRHAYFRHFSVKMFSRFGIPPELLDKTFHETSKTFKKW